MAWRNITDHFGFGEFFNANKCGETAEFDIYKAFYLARMILEPLRSAMGNKPLLITSGKRSADYNKKHGYAENSDHLFRAETAAVDVSFRSRIINRTAASWIYNNLLRSIGQLIIYVDERNEVRWIHISLPSRKNYRQALIASVELPRVYTNYYGGEITRPIIKER